MQVNPVAQNGGNVPLPNAGRSKKSEPSGPAEQGLSVETTGRARGVIRLLQEGHFQGVADVRLRINLADEIAALQTQANSRAAASGPGPILDQVDTILGDFLSQNELDPETVQQIQDARDTFATNIQQIFDSFAPNAQTPGQSLVDSVSAAVTEFIASIEALIPADTPDPVVASDAIPVDTPDGTTTDGQPVVSGVNVSDAVLPLGELVQRLREALDAAITGLQTQFNSAQVLPPLSPPSGNGRAYDKFLEILNGLYGIGSGSVDTAA